MKPTSRIGAFFHLLKLALAGKEQDYTRMDLNKAIFMLSVPMILEMLMESLFAVVDVFFVSRLGINSVATVGLTESVMMLVYSLAIGASMAVTAMVARRIGEKDRDGACIAAIQSLYVAISISLLISLSGLFYSEEILRLMGAEEEIIKTGAVYTRWMLGSNLVIMFLFLINAIFRGAGDAFLAMRALWIANILNIILDPVLIFGWGPFPAMGIEGAAVATNVGRGIGVSYQLYHLFNGKGVIKIARQHIQLRLDIIKRLLKVASGGTGQFLIASASWIFLMRIMSLFGSEALAGYTIGIRVLIFTILPAWGMANAAATLVGQNLGARQPERAESSVWRTAFYNMVFLGVVSIIYFVTASQVMAFFTDDEKVIQLGKQCLQYVSLGYVFFAYQMVIIQAFNGAGDTRTPTILSFFCFWLFQIPLAYALAVIFELGPRGVFLAIAISESTLAVVSILIFRKGKWKTTEI